MEKTLDENNSNLQVYRLRLEIEAMVSNLKSDSVKMREPQAQALFETSAEVLTGVATACRHYEEKSEIFNAQKEEEGESDGIGMATDGAPD